ncbi:MAG: 4'-phosphopantetheinyl transferase superfamily protein [Cyclobacteriaceae bacterium]|nr:4'-phosphopantetheinyl transferase superfamily protein [Cyclobacteriaceae bacterium]
MPLLKIHSLGEEKAWALWHMTESESELSEMLEESCPAEIVNEIKRREWLSGRKLIRILLESLELQYLGLTKDEFGKPFLKGHPHQISLSHSYPYVAAQIDRDNSVGIDLEQPKEKLRKIAPRVFSKIEVDDAGDNIVKLCIYWCAKEALYKIYGKRNLLFTDHLLIMPFAMENEGSISGKIQLPEVNTTVSLYYVIMKEFVIVYTV